MYDEDAVRWRMLAKQALEEEDEEKFVAIIQELNEILTRRHQRLKEQNRPFRPRAINPHCAGAQLLREVHPAQREVC